MKKSSVLMIAVTLLLSSCGTLTRLASSAEGQRFMDGIYATEDFQGFCYTQVSDVQQEVNGLLRPDRTPKFNLEKVKKITEGRA